MTQFEYVTTLAAFIVAFGVSRVLSGWVQQFSRRRESPIFPLQLAVSGLLLLGLLQNTWAIWPARQVVEWSFDGFLLLILVQMSVVGASALINPPPDSPLSVRDYYFDVRKAVFGLCVVWMVLGGLFDVYGVLMWRMPLDPDRPYALMYSVRALAVLLFAFMAWSDRESHHWAGFAVAAGLQIAWIVGVSFKAGTG